MARRLRVSCTQHKGVWTVVVYWDGAVQDATQFDDKGEALRYKATQERRYRYMEQESLTDDD